MKYMIVAAGLLLAACAPLPPVGPMAPDEGAILLEFPAMRSFAAGNPGGSLRPNSEIARDFADLSFRMESGRILPTFTRFETPITVRFNGPAPAHLTSDLEGLLARLRAEAGIDIRSTSGSDANIAIELVPARQLRQVAPGAACFVVPRLRSWGELRRGGTSGAIDWTTLQTRERAAVFVPEDATPQEMRDCLHEELAQALGPLNDLYRLPDSVFNDDNMHAVLTPFDMLILRVTYAPELSSGMSQAEVMALVPGILSRLNPAGERPGGQIPIPTPRDWVSAMETALSGGPTATRRSEAARAIAIGQAQGWTGARSGFAQYAFGRLHISADPNLALGAFNAAARAYRNDANMRIHAAHVDVQLAAFALIAQDAQAVLALTGPAIDTARRHENAALLTLLMMFRAEALDLQGQSDAAMALRLDSLGWGLYGFGSRDEVVARLNEIASLTQPRS